MKKTISLNKTWYGFILLVTLSPMIIIAILIGFEGHSLLLKNATLRELQFNKEIKTTINLETDRIITLLQNKSDPISFVLAGALNNDLIEKLFKIVFTREEAINSLSLISRENQVILSVDREVTTHGDNGINKEHSKNEDVQPNYEHLTHTTPPMVVIPLHGRTYVSSPVFKENSVDFDIGIPVGTLSHPEAVLVASVNTKKLWNEIYSILLRPEVTIYLVDSLGSLLYRPYSTDLQTGDLVTHMNIVRALIANEIWDSSKPYVGLNGVPVFGVSSYIDSLNWGVISEIPCKQITDPIYKTILASTGLILFIAIISGIIGLVFVNRLLKPFSLLNSAFRHVSNGYYDTKLVSSSVKEIDNVVSGFNSMTQQINQREIEISGFANILEESLNEIYIFNARTFRFIQVNKGARLNLGYTMEELSNLTPLDLSLEFTAAFFEKMVEPLRTGEKQKIEFTTVHLRKDGPSYDVEAHLQLSTFQSVPAFVAIIIDITESKKMEEALLQSEKLKSIGTITAGISHEFNNLLAIISGNVQLLEEDYKDDKVLTGVLSTIMKAADDGAEISGNMLKFTKTKPDVKALESTDIRDMIMQSVDFIKPRWENEAQAKGIDYKMDMEGMKSVPSIMCNHAEMREIFINLINNSLDAMPGGGSITFSTWSEHDTVFVGVSDTGEGMTDEVKKYIFDPFFSTKGVDGTGLGMSTVYGIVTRHGGKIDITSKIGSGTTFTMQFPATNKRRSAIETSDTKQETEIKSLRVLVVDDEAAIRDILNQLLSRSGHNVKTVDNGADAINMIEGEEFDLVLCDLAMPIVFGYDVVKALYGLKKRPIIGIITGWAEDQVLDNDMKVDFYLKKPFKHAELTKHINDVFGVDS